jgi:hypothetical protein
VSSSTIRIFRVFGINPTPQRPRITVSDAARVEWTRFCRTGGRAVEHSAAKEQAADGSIAGPWHPKGFASGHSREFAVGPATIHRPVSHSGCAQRSATELGNRLRRTDRLHDQFIEIAILRFRQP